MNKPLLTLLAVFVSLPAWSAGEKETAGSALPNAFKKGNEAMRRGMLERSGFRIPDCNPKTQRCATIDELEAQARAQQTPAPAPAYVNPYYTTPPDQIKFRKTGE